MFKLFVYLCISNFAVVSWYSFNNVCVQLIISWYSFNKNDHLYNCEHSMWNYVNIVLSWSDICFNIWLIFSSINVLGQKNANNCTMEHWFYVYIKMYNSHVYIWCAKGIAKYWIASVIVSINIECTEWIFSCSLFA